MNVSFGTINNYGCIELHQKPHYLKTEQDVMTEVLNVLLGEQNTSNCKGYRLFFEVGEEDLKEFKDLLKRFPYKKENESVKVQELQLANVYVQKNQKQRTLTKEFPWINLKNLKKKTQEKINEVPKAEHDVVIIDVLEQENKPIEEWEKLLGKKQDYFSKEIYINKKPMSIIQNEYKDIKLLNKYIEKMTSLKPEDSSEKQLEYGLNGLFETSYLEKNINKIKHYFTESLGLNITPEKINGVKKEVQKTIIRFF